MTFRPGRALGLFLGLVFLALALGAAALGVIQLGRVGFSAWIAVWIALPLLGLLEGLPVKDLELEEARLEDVVLKYYREVAS